MSVHDVILPAASQTLAVSRTNYNSSVGSILKCFYGNQLPASSDVNDEGTVGLVEGMLYRDSANATIFIRDSGAFKGSTGHVTGGFTRVGIGTRIVKTLASAAALGSGSDFTAFEVGELFCTVADTAGTSNNRLYMRTSNTSGRLIADVGAPPPGSVSGDSITTPLVLNYAANVTGNVSVTRSLSVGYADGAVAAANLEVKGNTYMSGAVESGSKFSTANGTKSVPSFTFTNASTSGLFKSANSTQGTTSVSTAVGGTEILNANTRGVYPATAATFDLGGLKDAWRSMHATNFYGQATSALYADLAERFEADEILEAGDVVMIGGEKEITLTDRESTPDVFGVISIKPAYAMNADGGSDDTHPYVALAGKVPVKVIGKVLKGQRLVASSQSGIAIAAETKNIFAVVGRALESSDELGVKLVNAAVGKL